MSSSKLFQPIHVGTSQLKHRIVFAPTTRFRADADHVPLPIVAEYYGQRSKVPGTLLITEATLIAPRAGGYAHVPGIWSDAQIAAWKRVTEAVHANGSFIYLQLWALGRTAEYSQLQKEDPSLPYVSASDIPIPDHESGPLRPLTIPEIKEYVQLYATAAENAVHKAGFDGVEIHGANGYLIDQFLQDVTNNRTDVYGGSIENRTRFAKEVVDSVVKAVGPERTGVRFSPWGTFNSMLMKDPIPTFSHIISYVHDTYPEISYLHLVEPRSDSRFEGISPVPEEINNDFARKIWGGRPLITAGGYNRQTAINVADSKGDIIAFSRAFIANPDLPFRLQFGIPLKIGNRATYYIFGSADPKGYTDYPFSEEFLKSPSETTVIA